MGKLSLAALVLVACAATSYVASVGASSRRAKSLSVSNANNWGDWGEPQYCMKNTYAVGYNMKIEGPKGSGDDTALNGIKIICKSASYGSSGTNEATSKVGPWGFWRGEAHCDSRGGKQHFLKSFSLQSEKKRGPFRDDTSANYVKFMCQPLDNSLPSYEMSKDIDSGSGKWGKYGSWSSDCPKGTAICGIRTRVEKPRGSRDDTALNDVQFYCCY